MISKRLKQLRLARGEELLGEPIDMDAPLSLVARQAFMKLPLCERQRILADQAAKMVAHYEQDTEWCEFQGGDFIEY
jgi:hypothetical protein